MAERPTTNPPIGGSGLSLAEHVCLALIVEEPRHGWSIVRELEPGGPLGGIWSLSRPLTYRALDQLEQKGLITRGAPEAGKGPARVTLDATEAGRSEATDWLHSPVRHVRDLRTEFLLKATLLQRQGDDVGALLSAQEAVLSPVLQSLGDDTRDLSPVGLWRSESAYAAQRFFGRLRAELTGAPAVLPSLSGGSAGAGPRPPLEPVRVSRDDLAEVVAELRAAGTDAVVARTVELRGFGPDRPGEVAIITAGGVRGTILRGALDGVLRDTASDLLASGRTAVTLGCSVDGDTASEVGLTCGGTLKVLAQRLESVPDLFWGDALGVPRASVTRLLGDDAGSTITVTQLGDRAGTLGDDAADDAALELAAGQMRFGVGGVTVIDDPAGDLLLDVVWSSRRLMIVGVGELASALVRTAGGLGWSSYPTESVAEAVTYLADAVPSDAIVVLSHNPTIDTPVLLAALASTAGYVGALGSRRTQAARRERLVAGGATEEQLRRLHGPAGLDLGAAGPSEIAVSIVAEMIAVRSGRSTGPLSLADGPIQNRFRTV